MFAALTPANMLVTGVLLAPAAMATPAIQDLADLRAVIIATANTIGDAQNPNRGWGFGGSSDRLGTADLINNITSTLLQSKFQIDTNRTAWRNLTEANATLNGSTPLPGTPTLPISGSMVLPTVLPTSTPSLENVTTDLSTPYTDYISSIPDLSTSLTSLGRAWHREMNAPIRQAIGVLQESISTLQTTMLQHDLINSSAVLRTVRASSSLESAEQAWSRFLNLPGRTGSSGFDGETSPSPSKRSVQRLQPANGRHHTHKELWGRKDGSRICKPVQDDAIVEWAHQDEHNRGQTRSFMA